jgi:Flp pilus assembly protein TadD
MDLHHLSRRIAGIGLLCVSLVVSAAYAKNLRITIPKRTKPTPVQQLNRDGVKAIEKHDYEKAKTLFYKAYLIDPNDPFTLNNLGYIAELEGHVERAQRYYDLASRQESDALVESSSDKNLKGEPVAKVAGNFADTAMQINRLNVEAIGLLQKNRAPEADLVLQKALSIGPDNPFTLNNMGYAKEKEGEDRSALSYYNAAAATRSTEPIIVTVNKDWRGKPISEVAAENARNLRKDMRKEQTLAARVARLNLQGVSAINRNDRREAKILFKQAYELDPHDAFTLNNMGYMADLDGDKETADFYYEKAAEAKQKSARVDVATRRDMEGKKVSQVADFGDQQVSAQMKEAQEIRAREGGPIELRTRNNQPVINKPPQPAASSSLVSSPSRTAGVESSGGGATGVAASPQNTGPTGPSENSSAVSSPTLPIIPVPQTKPSRPPVIPPLPDEQETTPSQGGPSATSPNP